MQRNVVNKRISEYSHRTHIRVAGNISPKMNQNNSSAINTDGEGNFNFETEGNTPIRGNR